MRMANALQLGSLVISLASLGTVLSTHRSSEQEQAKIDARIITANSEPAVVKTVVRTPGGLEKYTHCQGNWCVTDSAPVKSW